MDDLSLSQGSNDSDGALRACLQGLVAPMGAGAPSDLASPDIDQCEDEQHVFEDVFGGQLLETIIDLSQQQEGEIPSWQPEPDIVSADGECLDTQVDGTQAGVMINLETAGQDEFADRDGLLANLGGPLSSNSGEGDGPQMAAGTIDKGERSMAQQTALKNYAMHMNKPEAEVSLTDVVNSAEGLVHWATLGQDMGMRSACGQAFKRSIAKRPDAAAMYEQLPDAERTKFRQHWSVERTLGFIKEFKVKRQTQSTYSGEKGVFLTPLAIAAKLGGSQYSLCRAQAATYCNAAIAHGGSKLCQFNAWLGSWTFLFIEKLISSGTKTDWEMVSEAYDMVNPWEVPQALCLAVRA